MVDEAVRLLEAAVDTGGAHLKFSETPLQGLEAGDIDLPGD